MPETRRLKIGLCVDRAASMMQSYEEEIADHKDRLNRLFGRRTLSFYEANYPAEGNHGLQSGTDILVYDYGGMLPGCDDLLESNARAIIGWASDHPNGLVLIASSFTWNHQIKSEMEDSHLNLRNIVDFHAWDEENLPVEWRGMSVEEEAKTALCTPDRFTSSTFFQPTKKFADWMVRRLGDGILIDAGCGNGHAMRCLRARGARVIGVDINADYSADTSLPICMDAATFKYPEGCTVLIARPCHGDWVVNAIERARRNAGEILYVGLAKNVDDDLGDHAQMFRQVGKRAGADDEGVWSWKPQERISNA